MEGSTFNLNIILYEELMLSNCGAREGLLRVPWTQGDQTSQSKVKSTWNIHWKD